MSGKLPRLAGAVAAGTLAWGLFEAQFVECRELEVPVPALPPELDGLRILHLADLHLGSVSLNGRAFRKAVRFAERADPEIVALTGDLLARQRGEAELRRGLRRLRPAHGVFAVLGNVDVAVTRDPFSTGARLESLEPEAILLDDRAVSLEVRERRVQVVGAEPFSRRVPPAALADPRADLRILLAHFPDSVEYLPPGAFDLVLSGHTHDGQVCLPGPGGKIRLAGYNPYPVGTYRLPQGTLVVSRGTGTTFVPFRLYSRPEASLLVLRPG
jgi:hypothetical protein